MPKLASFFSGIGGFDLGFERAGFSLSLQVEIDRYCSTILSGHWPNVTRANDIKEVTGADIPLSEVWAGGFPCQDVSLARMGPRLGLKGRRSGLFFEFSRLLSECRPSVCLIENVPGLLSSHGGHDFRIVLQTLAGLGYSVGWRVLNSRYFGVPQSRQRVYIVGCHRDPIGPAKILFDGECGERHTPPDRSNGKKSVSPFKESPRDTSKGPVVPKLAYCLYACSARHTGTDWSRNYVSYADGRVRRLVPIECERLQGFPDHWTLPSAETVAKEYQDPEKLDSLRYHALGNAVTVNVASWLAERVSRYLSESESVDVELKPSEEVLFEIA